MMTNSINFSNSYIPSQELENPFNQDLFNAIEEENFDKFKLALENGANPNAVHNQLTALATAIDYSEVSMAQLLIEKGADVNVNLSTEGRNAPLLVAVQKVNSAPMVELLLNAGADPNVKDDYGCTPLYFAALFGKTTDAKMLIEANADVNLTNSSGSTPLHFACCSITFSDELIVELVKNGADLDRQDNEGKTPIDKLYENFKGFGDENLTKIANWIQAMRATFSHG